jgi:hypothetical protein
MPKYRVGAGQSTFFDLTRSWTGRVIAAIGRQSTSRSEPLRHAPRCIRREIAVRCLDEFPIRPASAALFLDEREFVCGKPPDRSDGGD